jgi:hypothetical protein
VRPDALTHPPEFLFRKCLGVAFPHAALEGGRLRVCSVLGFASPYLGLEHAKFLLGLALLSLEALLNLRQLGALGFEFRLLRALSLACSVLAVRECGNSDEDEDRADHQPPHGPNSTRYLDLNGRSGIIRPMADDLIPEHWRGVVRVRGEAWATFVLAEMRQRRREPPPWPPFGGSIVAKARLQVVDLLRLDPVGEALVRSVYEHAKAKYEELTQRR